MPERLYHYSDFSAPELAANRRRSISVCIPARNEEETIGAIVNAVVKSFTRAGGGIDLVDEVVVVDDGSTDQTHDIALGAGAKVVRSTGRSGGKGEAMHLALGASEGDLIVFLDGDVNPFAPHFVTGLVGAALTEDALLVKGTYMRPLNGIPNEGGRVNELVARPIISLLFPELSWIRQPLAGETAITRTVLEKLQIAPGYGVEMGLLLDVASMFGVGAIAQVDLGVREHRNRPLSDLRPQATEVMRVALVRAGLLSL
jgi:glucosyl-3-phosphoglycerate synthase